MLSPRLLPKPLVARVELCAVGLEHALRHVQRADVIDDRLCPEGSSNIRERTGESEQLRVNRRECAGESE